MSTNFPAISDEQHLLQNGYKLLKTIGEGTYAKVKLAEHLFTGEEVAIKMVKLKDFASFHRFLMQEVRCMKALQHPHIVQLYQVIEVQLSFFIVMEYVSGSTLLDYLKSRGRMREGEARCIFRQILSAVHHCHQRGFAHRNIRPENILFDNNMNIKMADFGSAMDLSKWKVYTKCCSPSYLAPEVFLDQGYEATAMDIWSLGVTLYRMVAGTLPFEARNWKELGEKVTRGEYTVPYFFSYELESFLRKMLAVKPEERGELTNIMSDPWVNQDEEDLMLYREPRHENIDHCVKEEMQKLGFRYEDIQDTLTKNTFNYIMATYRILKTNKLKFPYGTIHVKPYNYTEQSPTPSQEVQSEGSNFQQAEQDHNDHELGQDKKSAGSPAHQKLRTATPRHGPEPSTVPPGPDPEPRTVTPGRGPEPSTVTPGPGPEPMNMRTLKGQTIPSARPEFKPDSHKLRLWWRSPASIPGCQRRRSEDSLANYGPSSPSSSETSEESRRGCCSCFPKLWFRLSRKGLSKRNKVTPLSDDDT